MSKARIKAASSISGALNCSANWSGTERKGQVGTWPFDLPEDELMPSVIANAGRTGEFSGREWGRSARGVLRPLILTAREEGHQGGAVAALPRDAIALQLHPG